MSKCFETKLKNRFFKLCSVLSGSNFANWLHFVPYLETNEIMMRSSVLPHSPLFFFYFKKIKKNAKWDFLHILARKFFHLSEHCDGFLWCSGLNSELSFSAIFFQGKRVWQFSLKIIFFIFRHRSNEIYKINFFKRVSSFSDQIFFELLGSINRFLQKIDISDTVIGGNNPAKFCQSSWS